MNIFNFWAAFAAGVLSFLSPCILPLLPGYLSFITGFTLDKSHEKPGRFRAVKGALAFGAGFSLVFIAMGATATAVGRLFVAYQHIFTAVLGVVVIIMGLHLTGIFRIKFFYNEKKLQVKPKREAKYPLVQAFIIGLAFAFGWTPCVGPILGGILTLAANQDSVTHGILLLSAYSLGLWLPFLAAALFTTPILSFLSKHPKLALRAEQIAGILLIIVGILLVTGYMSYLSTILS